MCREGQLKVPRAIIVADKKFPGDSEAFKIKHQRAREEKWLRLPFNEMEKDVVEDAWERVEGLEGDDLAFDKWRRVMRTKERIRRAEQRQPINEKVAEIGDPAAEIRARFRQNKAVGSKSNPVEL